MFLKVRCGNFSYLTLERQRSGETEESPFQTRIIEDSESAFQRKFIYNVFHLHICV